MNDFSRSKVMVADGIRTPVATTHLTGAERLEGDDGEGVLDTRKHLHLFVHEVADVGIVLDIELDQQIVLPGGGVDLGRDLGFGKRIGDQIGLAELAFDLDEERNHRGRLQARIDPNRPDLPAKASNKAGERVCDKACKLAGDSALRLDSPWLPILWLLISWLLILWP